MHSDITHNYDGKCRCEDCCRYELELRAKIREENSYEMRSLLSIEKKYGFKLKL